MLENGKLAVIKSSVASTPELEMGLADLSLEIRRLQTRSSSSKTPRLMKHLARRC